MLAGALATRREAQTLSDTWPDRVMLGRAETYVAVRGRGDPHAVLDDARRRVTAR